MFSHKLAFLFPLALVASINAQSSSSATTSATSVPSSPGGISPCILQCVTTAAEQNGCQSFADISCVCTSIPFQQASLACLQANCTSDDVTTATQLQQSECGSVSGSGVPSGSGSATAPVSGSTTQTVTVPSGSSTVSVTQVPPLSSASSPAVSGASSGPSGSGTSSGAGTSDTSAGSGAVPVRLVSGPGVALAVVAGLAGVIAGAGLIL